MSRLDDQVEDYLRLRRSVGYKLSQHGWLLHGFTGYLDRVGADHVTTRRALEWATLPRGVRATWWNQRLGVVRGFAAYAATIDPRTEVPPRDLLARDTNRRTPYLFSPAEISALMVQAGRSRYPLKAATYQTLIGLLAATGMRAGEAIGLDRGHVDLDRGVITVVHTKFGKSRRLPLHPSVIEALADYDRRRDQLCAHPHTDAFFVSLRRTRLQHSVMNSVFRQLVRDTRIGRGDHRAPVPHDLRHSFAVSVLLEWYRQGVDVGNRLPALSTYLGHVGPSSTYWYMQAAPELLALTVQRLERP